MPSPEKSGPETVRNYRRTLWWLVVILALVAIPFAVAGWWIEPQIERWLESEWFRSHRLAGTWLAAVLLCSDILVPVPASVVCTWLGAEWGPGWGGLVSAGGLFLSAALGFLIGRTPALRKFAGFAETGPRSGWNGLPVGHAPWMVAAMRPLPLLAESSVLAAGLFGVPWRRCWPPLALSCLGLGMAWAGLGSISSQNHWLSPALAVAAILPAVALALWISRFGPSSPDSGNGMAEDESRSVGSTPDRG